MRKKKSENSKQFIKGKIGIAEILNKCYIRLGIFLENRRKRPKIEKENEKKKY